MTETRLLLPFPPSVNGLYDGGVRTKHRFKSDAYKLWELEAGLILNTQRNKIASHPGKVIAHFTYGRPDNRRRDVANYEKAVSDLLVKHGVIVDDCMIESITLRWSKIHAGVQIRIRDIE